MSKIFQLKIKILDAKPPIWRRVQVRANCSFWDLHIVLVTAFDWSDLQKHYFRIIDPNNKKHIIKSYLDDYEDNIFPLSWSIEIKKYFLNDKYKIYYVYGTDEDTVHQITLEKTIYKKLTIKYPICTAGKGIPYEDDSEEESLIGQQIRSTQKFKVDNVLVIEGRRALAEHKIKLFDSLYF